MTTVLLVRHGIAQDAEGRALGWTDRPLAAEGRAGIEAHAATWTGPPPARCWTSDLARTRETAAILATRWTTLVEPEPRLREMHFGDWDGRSWAELDLESPSNPDAWSEDWPSIRAPGGESFDDVVRRVSAWLATLPRDAGDYLVVAHAGSIRAAAVALLGISPSRAFSLALDHATVSTFELSNRGASLIRWNSSGF